MRPPRRPRRLALRRTDRTLRRLNQRLEQELRRVAHSLHDDVGQLLAAMHLALEDVRREAPAPIRPRLTDLLDRVDEVAGRLRHISHELRPTMLDDLGLVPALRFLAAGIAGRGRLAITVEGAAGGRLPPAVETALYRITQEALTNVVRHAGARRAEVRVDAAGGTLRLAIRDDGAGFDVARARRPGAPTLGLAGIAERAGAVGGSVEIRSTPGAGTELRVSVPLDRSGASIPHGDVCASVPHGDVCASVPLDGSCASVPLDGSCASVPLDRGGGSRGADPPAARR